MFEIRMHGHGHRALATVQSSFFLKAARVISRTAALAALCVFVCSVANAQTAHFSWAYSQLAMGDFETPSAVAVDAYGNLYVADIGNNTVFEVLAVNGVIPASPAIISLGAGFDNPYSLAVDPLGNVYVANFGNGLIQEIPPGCVTSGCIKNLGIDFGNPAALALDGAGNVYVADMDLTAIQEIPVGCTSSSCIKPLGSGFNEPTGVAVDSSGNVYVADTGNHALKQMVAVNGSIPSSPTIVTLVGSAKGLIPTSVALSGQLVYFGDENSNGLYQFSLTSGALVQLLSGAYGPAGVATDAAGNVYMADAELTLFGAAGFVDELSFSGGNFGQVKVASAGGTVTLGFTFDTAGSGVSPAVFTQGAAGMDFADAGTGSCDTNKTTHSYSAGSICTVDVTFTPGFPGARYGAVILKKSSGATIATGNLQGAGLGPQIVFPSNNTPIALGTGFDYPQGMVVDPKGNIYVSDTFNGLVKEMVAVNGVIPSSPAINTIGEFNRPTSLAIDGSGNIYVANHYAAEVNEIVAVNGAIPASPIIRMLGTGFAAPWGVAVDGKGNVYVADPGSGKVQEIVAVNGVIPASPAINTLATGQQPTGVAVDGSGNVYFTDGKAAQVYEIQAVDGVMPDSPNIRTLGSGFSEPYGVAVDENGNVYVIDWNLNTLYKIEAINGVIPSMPVIDTLNSGFQLPCNVVLDASGNIYVAGGGDEYVASAGLIELPYATPPSLSFPATAEDSTSAPQTVPVENFGNAPVTLLAIGYPDIFPEYSPSGDTCSSESSLGGGSTCKFTVDFAPQGPGAYASDVVLVDDSLYQYWAIQYFPVSGFGLNAQAITFTDSLPTSANYSAGLSYTLSATGGTSGNPVTFSLVSGPATVVGSSLNITGAGVVVVAANQAGNATYAAAPQVTQSITIKLASQTITFPPITATQYAGTTLPLSASASSGLTVAFASTTPTVCTVSGTTASLLISGACAIQATQAGSTLYAAASMVQQTLNIHHQTQTITFSPITATQHAVTQLPLTATASSGLPVAYTSTTLTVCTVAGSTASLLAPGTCILQANQAGNATYSAAPQVSQYFTVHLATQTISFPAITATEYAATTLPLSASATSGLTVVFASTTPTICTVLGTTATLATSGTCGIQATQPGNTLYAAAPLVQQNIAVHHQTQTINFPQIASQLVGAQVTLSATASSGLAVIFTSATGTVCSVTGTTATMLTTGTCTIHANQAGNGVYSMAPQVAVSFAVKAGS